MTRPDRWEQAADRDLARRQRAAGPLFASLVERKAPEAVRTRAEALVAAQAAMIANPERLARFDAQGAVDRATVAAHVSGEELAELDRRRAWCPPEACYTADFWQEECRRRGLPWSGQAAHEAFWAPIHAALEKLRGAEDARHATAGEQLDLLAPEPDR